MPSFLATLGNKRGDSREIRASKGSAVWPATLSAPVLLCLFLAVPGCTQARADALDGRRLTFGGFGTLALDYNDGHDLEYRRSIGQPDQSNDRRLDVTTDSLAGLQINAAWNRQLEVVLQAVSRSSADRGWRPRLTRGFIRYVPDDWLMLRAGRIGNNLYPHADSADIGYSSATLRPPVEMFGQLSSPDFDGADIKLTKSLGAMVGSFRVFGGAASGTVVEADGSIHSLAGSRIWGTEFEFSKGAWSTQLGVGWYQVSHNLAIPESLIAGLQQTGDPQAEALASEFAAKGRRTAFIAAGLSYDGDPWHGQLYLVRSSNGNSIGPMYNIGSLVLGYRIGKLTPYGLVSRSYNYADIQSTGLPETPQTAGLIAGAYAVQTLGNFNQSSVATGLRYDFAHNLDLKFQVDRVWSQGSLLVLDHASPPRNQPDLTVFGLALDFVF